jgi:hypothetical protein
MVKGNSPGLPKRSFVVTDSPSDRGVGSPPYITTFGQVARGANAGTATAGGLRTMSTLGRGGTDVVR